MKRMGGQKVSKKKKTIEELLGEALVLEEHPYKIPDNWIWVRLGYISNYIQRGKSPKYVEFSNVKVISQKCVQWSGFDITRARYINEETLKNYQKERFLQKNDLLWNSTGTGTIGRIALITDELEGIVVADSHVTVVRPENSVINSQLLYRWLSSPYVQNKLNNAWSGSTNQVELNLSTVKQHQVPLPPLNEQKRIAEKVERLLSKIEEAKQLIEEAKETFELRRAAILDKAFRGELTRKWREENGIDFIRKEVKISELISGLNQGWSPKCENYPSKDYQKWGVIKTTAIQHMDFIEEENKQLPVSLEPREKHELKAGDILITRAGPRVRVGVCCLIKRVRPRLLLCDKAYRFRANLGIVTPEFLVLALNTPEILGKINTMKTGISESGVNLTQNGFSAIELTIPPINEQKEIVRIVDNLLKNEQKAIGYCDVIEKIDSLKQSILSKAFRGELGTNDSSEENAIELIKEVLKEQVK
ncbi:type I restriction enzyme, S subunit [Bacillus sp. 153480031-1]